MRNPFLLVMSLIRKVIGRGLIVSYGNGTLLAKKYGQFYSAKKRSSVDSLGRPIPWYTYPTIEYLDNIDIKDLRVLEYGSGNSSIYYLNRGAIVFSVEDDKSWFNQVSKNSTERHTYIFSDQENDYIERSEIFTSDIVVIDGSYRVKCADYVLQTILNGKASPSLIIFDNSDWHPSSIARLDNELRWHRVDFCGFGPINGYTWVTSIYLNPNSILKRVSHIASLCGNLENWEIAPPSGWTRSSGQALKSL